MTSNYTVGFGDETKVNSRGPPHNEHTDIFGGGDPEPAPNRGRRQAPTIAAQANASEKPTEVSNLNGNSSAEAAPQEAKKVETAEKPKEEPAKRTHVPPGGYSSGFW